MIPKQPEMLKLVFTTNGGVITALSAKLVSLVLDDPDTIHEFVERSTQERTSIDPVIEALGVAARNVIKSRS